MSNAPQLNNYFSMLGLEVKFKIDKTILTHNYRQLQRQFHPDNFAHNHANSSAMEKRLSVQKSAQINDAFQTLKDPLKRAIYQLSLLGLEFKDNETTSDPSFLMQQLELREKLGCIKEQEDPFEALEKMQAQVTHDLTTYIEKISLLFDSSIEQSSREEIKTTITKMQFLTKLQQQCEDLEEDLSNQL